MYEVLNSQQQLVYMDSDYKKAEFYMRLYAMIDGEAFIAVTLDYRHIIAHKVSAWYRIFED